MAFKLVVWDFDGTLADSLPTAVSIFDRLAPEMGFKPLEDVNAARGMTTRQLMRHHGVSLWRLPRLVRRFQALAAEEADNLKLASGLSAALASIGATGVRLGVLSSNREDNIRRCLRATGRRGTSRSWSATRGCSARGRRSGASSAPNGWPATRCCTSATSCATSKRRRRPA